MPDTAVFLPTQPEITIKNYYLNTKKSGEVLTAFMKLSNKSFNVVRRETDIDYDTLRNHLYGHTQKVSIDVVLKVLSVTGHTIFEYFTALFSADDVHVYDDVVAFPKAGEVSEVQVVEVPTPVSDILEIPPVAVQVPSTEPAVIETVIKQTTESQDKFIDRVSAHYQNEIDMIHKMYGSEIDLLERRYTETFRFLSERVDSLEKQRDHLMQELIVDRRSKRHMHAEAHHAENSL